MKPRGLAFPVGGDLVFVVLREHSSAKSSGLGVRCTFKSWFYTSLGVAKDGTQGLKRAKHLLCH